jgi:type II secretory pathway pseudopilin PulG
MLRSKSLPPCKAWGFTLPAILVVVAALLILAVAALLIVGIERNTSRAFSDHERAKLAARAGLEEVKGILNREAANDDFIVIQATLNTPIVADHQAAPQLFLVRGEADGNSYSYRWVPLFSHQNTPPATALLTAPAVDSCIWDSSTGTAANSSIDFTTLPYIDKVRAAWLPVKDEKNRTVGRYAYWVEDRQSRLDPTVVGNAKGAGGIHARAAWPFPAAGLNPSAAAADEAPLDQVALYALDPAATRERQGELAKNLAENRKLLVSPDSLLAAANISPPLERLKSALANGKIGELEAPKSRAVEEGLASGLHGYLEQPRVPFAEGIAPAMAGKPKLNLNQLLATGGSAAVAEMADFIKQALPKFDSRKGGFPSSEDYLKTLAANAIDYADSDSEATVGAGYRGLDAYPLVSEFLMRFRWSNVISQGGRKFVVLKVATYVELWNMTDQAVSGAAQMTHDTRYRFQAGVSPEELSLADMSAATSSPPLTQSDDSYWFAPIPVSLEPNEYRVITCGEVSYQIDAADSGFFIASPLLLQHEDYGKSHAGYKFKWNGKLVDQSRGGVHRNNSSLKFPANAPGGGSPQTVRTTIPAQSYASAPGQYINNMGDSRMSFYLSAPQDAVAYPVNFSPNRRNIRYQIYRADGPSKTKVYARVLPSEWPDGGHNSTCESTTGMTESSSQLDPDAAPFQLAANSVLRHPAADDAPMRLSSATNGRFYSATELGRVYDPILWKVAPPAGANLPWGDVLTTTAADSTHGGGNTLRIGRPEHPRFDQAADPGKEARHLLDLFHAGRSRSRSAAEREGPLVQIQGQVNINTASRDALRAIAVGALTMDPKMAKRLSEDHETTGLMAPAVTAFQMTATEIHSEAERIADAILLTRKSTPFASPSELAEVRDSTSPSSHLVFGNKSLIPDGALVDRSDSAAEEIFARVYEASTVRSRNFRIWVIGQAITPSTSSSAPPRVLSEVHKVFTVFADPGQRLRDGTIDPTQTRLKILHENDF